MKYIESLYKAKDWAALCEVTYSLKEEDPLYHTAQILKAKISHENYVAKQEELKEIIDKGAKQANKIIEKNTKTKKSTEVSRFRGRVVETQNSKQPTVEDLKKLYKKKNLEGLKKLESSLYSVFCDSSSRSNVFLRSLSNYLICDLEKDPFFAQKRKQEDERYDKIRKEARIRAEEIIRGK